MMNIGKTLRRVVPAMVLVMGSVIARPQPAAAFGTTYIVRDNKVNADIVIAKQPPRAVKLAALELSDGLFKISGARLPIVTAPGADMAAHIYVGRSDYTDRLKITDEGLKYGAFRMVSGKDWLVLLGRDRDYSPPAYAARNHADRQRALKEWDARTGEKWENPFEGIWITYSPATGLWECDERGSLNAAYAFLYDLGMRWYMPGELGEIVPKSATVRLPKVDRTVKPDFPYRNLGASYAPNFAGGTRDAILYKLRLGLEPTMGIPGPHGLNAVNGRDEVKRAHPEYFALCGGLRATNGPFFASCFSSKGLFDATVKYARAMFDMFPDLRYVSIWPNDGFSMCQCELCQGKDAPERGWDGYASDYVWDFTERVARELYKTHPDRIIVGGSYGAYALPPEKIARFSPNVMVGIVQPRKNFIEPETRARALEIRKGFLEKVAPGNLYVYNHYLFSSPQYGQSGLPIYFPHVIAEDLRSLKGISQGEFIELASAGDDMHAPGFNHLNVYVTGRYYWNADQDIDALLDEYYRLFYGPAAGTMKAFIEFSEKNWPSMQTKVEPIDRALELLAAAQRAAGNTVYGRRIALVADVLQPLKERRAKLAEGRPKGLPQAVAVERKNVDAELDGTLGESFWKDVPAYELVDLVTAKPCVPRTTFQVVWSGRSVLFGLRCEDPDMKNLAIGTKRNDDASIWNGDLVELLVETQEHSYYQIAINPAGAMMDIDRKGRMESRWSSGARVATHIGDSTWTLEALIPTGDAVEGGLDPLRKVEGKKPTAVAPWYINVCRTRTRGTESHDSAFAPTGEKSNFHVLRRFAELTVK